MKTLNKAILALAASSIVAVSANAAVNYGGNSVGQPYVGVKVGQLSVDNITGTDGDLTSYGVYAGYNFDQNFGVEAEYQGTDSDKYTYGSTEYELEAKTYGAYGTYRYNFNNTPFYAKGKLGLAKTEVTDKSVNGSYKAERDTTRLAGGVGLGYQYSNFGLEASYNYLDSDTSQIALGAHLAF